MKLIYSLAVSIFLCVYACESQTTGADLENEEAIPPAAVSVKLIYPAAWLNRPTK